MSICKECKMEDLKTEYESLPPPTEDEFSTALEEISKIIQADTCVYKSDIQTGTQTTSSTKGVFFGLMGGGSHYETEEEIPIGANITEIGCESIMATASKYAQTKNMIVSILSCTCSSTKVDVALRQKMKITLSGVVCKGNLSIAQNIKANVNMVNEITEEQQQEITSITETFLDSTLETMVQDIENSGEGTDVSLTTNVQDISEELIIENASKSVSEIIGNFNTDQVMDITITDSEIGEDCSFDQNIVLRVIASQVLSSSLKNLLDTTGHYDIVSKIVTEKTKEQDEGGEYTTGIDDIFNSQKGNALMWIGIIMGILLLFMIFVFVAYNSQKKQAANN